MTATLTRRYYGDMTKMCDVHQVAKVQRMRGHQRSGWYCRDCANDAMKARRVAEPEAYMDTKLWTFYRIRLVDFRRMWTEQEGRCAACGGQPEPGAGFDGRGLVIDHDHACCPSTRTNGGGGGRICGGCIRGLVCPGCNVAAGMAGDSPARLRAIADYLERVT